MTNSVTKTLSKKKLKQVQQANIQNKINLERIQEEYHNLTKVDGIFRAPWVDQGTISEMDKKLFGLFFT